jgi:hypothetical protein
MKYRALDENNEPQEYKMKTCKQCCDILEAVGKELNNETEYRET